MARPTAKSADVGFLRSNANRLTNPLSMKKSCTPYLPKGNMTPSGESKPYLEEYTQVKWKSNKLSAAIARNTSNSTMRDDFLLTGIAFESVTAVTFSGGIPRKYATHFPATSKKFGWQTPKLWFQFNRWTTTSKTLSFGNTIDHSDALTQHAWSRPYGLSTAKIWIWNRWFADCSWIGFKLGSVYDSAKIVVFTVTTSDFDCRCVGLGLAIVHLLLRTDHQTKWRLLSVTVSQLRRTPCDSESKEQLGTVLAVARISTTSTASVAKNYQHICKHDEAEIEGERESKEIKRVPPG